jgi:type I restriction enzyme S subunit
MKKGWQTKPLGEVCERVTVGHVGITAPFYRDEGIMFLRTQNVGKLGLDLDDVKYITPEFHASLKKSEVKGGDILMSRVITHTVNCALVPTDLGVANCANVVLVRPGKAVIPEFLTHYIRSPIAQKHLLDRKVGSAQLVVNTTVVKEWPVPLPPLAEQQRIVGLLDEAFEGLATAKANAEKNLQNARALFESHLQAVFTQGGPGWVETTLEQATAGVFTGPFGSLLHKHDYIENGIPLVNPAHITDTGIEPDMRKTVSEATAKRLANYIMNEGDVVIGRRGEMGRCALVTEVEDGWLCGTGSFFIKPSERCDMGYLVHYLRSDGCRKHLEALAGGAVMPNLSNTALGGLSIFLPSLREQKEIVNEIDALSAETQRLASLYERKLAALEALKKSLLHQAFSGTL